MAEAKTKPTKQSVKDFFGKLSDKQTRDDCIVIAKMMEEATGQKGVMWGPSIVGFDTRVIQYAGGREADWPRVAFSPRKQALTLYVGMADGFDPKLMGKLGKHTTAKGCLYIKRLSDVDLPTLKKLIKASAKK